MFAPLRAVRDVLGLVRAGSGCFPASVTFGSVFMTRGDLLMADRNIFASGRCVLTAVSLGTKFLTWDEASVDRLTLVAALSTRCLLARLNPARAFLDRLVATQLFAPDLLAFRLAPLSDTHLVSHARLAADPLSEFIPAAELVIAMLDDVVLETRLYAVLSFHRLFLDTDLLAVVDCLHFLACLEANPLLLGAWRALSLALGQKTVLNRAAALPTLPKTSFVLPTV